MKWYDVILRGLGLMRVSQQPVRDLVIRRDATDVDQNYISITLWNGQRFVGIFPELHA